MSKRLVIWGSICLLVMIGLIMALWPRHLPVDIETVSTGPLMQTVGDEGETRVVDIFVVSAPITGRLRRIEAESGDTVVAGETIVAEIEPTESQLLDPRTEAEARAQLSAAESAASLAEAELDKAKAELRFAEAEFNRSRELAQKGTISESNLDAAERALDTSRAAMGVAQATMQVRQYELARVRARLMSPAEMASSRKSCECIHIRAPVDGQILRVLRESEGFVRAGEGLIEIGNPNRLELVVDLLSVDAVKIEAGDSALVENWGGDVDLHARVSRVEPFGFTKVSALGIEEQRVNVVLDMVSPRKEWQALGHGYQVDVRIILWEGESVLQVPLTALFRDDEDWALFVNDNGKARKRMVKVGHKTATDAEILSGLRSGEQIVVYPSENIDQGVRIAAR